MREKSQMHFPVSYSTLSHKALREFIGKTPVSLPIDDQSGNLIQILNAPEGNRFGVLFSFAEGTERSIEDEEISYLFGKAVADIHLQTDGFQSELTRQPLDLEYLIHQSLVSIEPYMTHRSEDFEWLRTIAKQLEERLLEFPLDELDWEFCHGDLCKFKTELNAITLRTKGVELWLIQKYCPKQLKPLD